MDYEQDWTNSRDEPPLSPWRNKSEYFPSCYLSRKNHGYHNSGIGNHQSMYASGGESNFLCNFPCCRSPEYPNCINYLPESHMSNEHENFRYPSYSPHLTPFRHREDTEHSCQSFPEDTSLNSDFEVKQYYSRLYQHQCTNTYPKTSMPNYSMRTNRMKQSGKKKRKLLNASKNKRVKKRVDSSLNTSMKESYIETINNNNNLLTNCSKISEFPTVQLNTPTAICEVVTEADALINKDLLNRQLYLPQGTVCEFPNIQLNALTAISEVTKEADALRNEDLQLYVPQTMNITSEIQRKLFLNSTKSSNIKNNTAFIRNNFENIPSDPNQNFVYSSTNEENNSTNEFNYFNAITMDKEIESNICTDRSDLFIDPVEKIPFEVTEQHVEIPNKDLGSLEEKTESMIFHSIFEGKDLNGEDVIVLFAPLQQEITQENIDTQNPGFVSNLEMRNNLIENKELCPQNGIQGNNNAADETDHEVEKIYFGSEKYSQHDANATSESKNYMPILQFEGTDIFFSAIDDFVSEDTEITVKSNSTMKSTKRKENSLSGNVAPKKNKMQRKKSDSFLQEIDHSEIPQLNKEEFSDKINDSSSSLIRNRKKCKASFASNHLKWKRRFQGKSNMKIYGFKNIFVSEIMKFLKIQDKNIKHRTIWQTMRNKIGSTVLHSICDTFQTLAKMNTKKSYRKTVSTTSKKK